MKCSMLDDVAHSNALKPSRNGRESLGGTRELKNSWRILGEEGLFYSVIPQMLSLWCQIVGLVSHGPDKSTSVEPID
jgi:hypothetical protein